MKRNVLLLYLAFILVFMACQPTPDHEIVPYRGDNDLQSLITIPIQSDSYELPTKWTEEITIHKSLKLNIDTEIEIGEGNTFPVTTISRADVTGEWVFHTLTSVWETIADQRDQQYSQEELLEDMSLVKRGVFEDLDENGNPIWVPFDDEEDRLSTLQQTLYSTPSTPSFSTFSAAQIHFNNQYAVRCKDGSLLYYYVSNWDSGNAFVLCSRERLSVMQDELMVLEGDAFPGEQSHTLNNVNISQQDAEAIAQLVLDRLGKHDFSLAEASKARSLNRYWAVTSEGWRLRYTVAGGSTLPSAYSMYVEDSAFQTTEAYAPSWPCEMIELYITENGVERFLYNNPYSTVRTVNQSVNLLPFSDIQTRIRELFRYSYAWTGDGRDYGIGNRIDIRRIVLTEAITQFANQGNEALYVPVWAVYYQSEFEQKQYMPDHIMLVNAIDGSLIASN